MLNLPTNNRIKVALLSCGLGNVNRGFEVSAARWKVALANEPRLDVRLFAGGTYPQSTTVFNLSRDFLWKHIFLYVPFLDDRRRWEMTYGMEQITYALGFLPALLSWKPDVVWTKEAPLAHILDTYRKIFNLRFKIIFANGGAFRPNTYRQFDFIQHLQPDSFHEGLNAGIPESKMCTLCNCVPYINVLEGRSEIRKDFGYGDNDYIIACVAAWNRYHKRIDYLIEEVAKLNDPDIQLLLIGHPDTETAGLKKLAAKKLGHRTQWLTLPNNQVPRALKLADLFVLPSLDECLGGSLIEAAMAGLPIISHPHPGARFILQDDYWMSDLSQVGNLSKRILEIKKNHCDEHKIRGLQNRVIDHFSETTQSRKFCEMVLSVVSGIPTQAVTECL